MIPPSPHLLDLEVLRHHELRGEEVSVEHCVRVLVVGVEVGKGPVVQRHGRGAEDAGKGGKMCRSKTLISSLQKSIFFVELLNSFFVFVFFALWCISIRTGGGKTFFSQINHQSLFLYPVTKTSSIQNFSPFLSFASFNTRSTAATVAT